jgi:uncharacterized membrane protein YfcA
MTFIILFLSAAGFLAGFVDSVAGGGGLITLPALLVAGMPPHLALGTNKFQSMFGTSFALANFARKTKVIWKIAAVWDTVRASGVGDRRKACSDAISGRACQDNRSSFAAGGPSCLILKGVDEERADGGGKRFVTILITPAVCFVIGMYDGFLGPGTGTFLILALVLFARLDLVNASATAKTFNLASNVGAFVTFVISGYVYYPYAAAMAVANIAGNMVGSHYAIKHGGGFYPKDIDRIVDHVVYVSCMEVLLI